MNWSILLKTLEGLNYIATVGVLIVAIVGLRQINLTKKVAKITSRRESLALASKQVEQFLGPIVNKSNILDQKIANEKIDMFKKSEATLSDEDIVVKIGVSNKELTRQVSIIAGELTSLFNSIEAFATYFTSELADERIAYGSIGRSYCSMIEDYLPIVAPVAGKSHYQNCLSLYRIWKDRSETETLLVSKDEIETKLNKRNGKVIIPVGTGSDL